MRPTRAEVDLDAVRHNVAVLVEAVAPAALCAVVKADGYGHGAIAVGQAALDAGATWLAVALVEEGAVLRKAGIEAPILLLSQPRGGDVMGAIDWDLRVCVYTPEGIAELGAAAAAQGRTAVVHLKIDTGMRRVGAEPSEAVQLARSIADHGSLELEAVWTHCAVADEPEHPFTGLQLDRLDAVLAEFERAGLRPSMVHAANSAAAIAHPRSRMDLARVGIAVYGIAPSPVLAERLPLRSALTLRTEVSHVKQVGAGEGVSYGLRYVTDAPTVLATVPIGYADGVPRSLARHGGQVLIGGRRCPMAGVVTMDQLVVDCGAGASVAPGDDVVLLGAQGDERITPDEWAGALDTIAYEIVCGIGPRVSRHYRS